MALAATIVWEVRFGGNDTNGGGFKTGATGTDWTLQDAAQYSVTDGVTDGTTTITSATANFGTDVVGNVMYVQGGTGSITAGWYEITSRTNATTIVVDRSTGLTAGTGVTLKIGGALATPARAAGSKVAGNDVFIKYNASPYIITTTSSNVAGGIISENTGSADTGQAFWTGYDSTRTVINTDANRPTIQIAAEGVTTVTMFDVAALCITIRNLILDGNSKVSIRGFDLTQNSGGSRTINCKVMNCTNTGFMLGTTCVLVECEATGCATAGSGFRTSGEGGTLYACYAHDNTVSGIVTANFTTCVFCVSESNSGASSYGFSDASTATGIFLHCTAYNNGSDGFHFSTAFGRNQTAINCVSDSNTGYGYNASGSNSSVKLINCAHRNNTGGSVHSNITISQGAVTLTGAPFADAAGGDFRPNSTAGAGADLRDAAYPTTLPGSTTTWRLDIGGAQHDDPAGGTPTYTRSRVVNG